MGLMDGFTQLFQVMNQLVRGRATAANLIGLRPLVLNRQPTNTASASIDVRGPERGQARSVVFG